MTDYRSDIIKADDIKDLPINPNLKDLTDDVKSKEAHDKIVKKIGVIMYSDHQHRKVTAFVKCKRCQAKVKKRDEYLKSIGFKDYQQFMSYKRVIKLMQSNA